MSSFEFLPVQVTRDEIVAAARAHLGLKYSAEGTWCHERSDGTLTGQCDCAGLFLLVARRLGLLPPEIDVNLAPEQTGVSRETALAAILLLNFDRIEIGEALPGDLFIIRLDPEQSDGRHLAIKTSDKPAPYGSMLHNQNPISGRVWEARIDGHDFGNIQKAYRLKEAFLSS